MRDGYKLITKDNIESEHLCCAISDKKHEKGVSLKKEWLSERLEEGHIFRKLDARGKVFIEYAPLEKAWVPIEGDNYLYIYCLWIAGSFKGKGYGKALLEYCIEDGKSKGKSGICILSSKKKKPYTSEKKFLQKYGFKVVDNMGDYELMALCFDENMPKFVDTARANCVESKNLTVYYSNQCPYIVNCIEQIENYCKTNDMPYKLELVDTIEKAKAVPGIFNNWAVFYKGKYETNCLLNENMLKKFLIAK